MRRRDFISLIGGAAAIWPVAARAQQNERLYRVGLLFPGTLSLRPQAQEFWHALAELGYVDGKNLIIEVREARGELSRLPSLAMELVASHPDVIVAVTNSGIAAAKNATNRIPIVMAIGRDPMGNGFVDSLARPEGNITGSSNTVSSDIVGKRMQILTGILPGHLVIGIIWNPINLSAGLVEFAERAASAAGNQTISLPFQRPQELNDVFKKTVAAGTNALLIMPDPVEFDHRREVIDFTLANRIPSVTPFPEEAEEGALAAYGVRLTEDYRQPAYYVAKILQGAKPVDLPIQQPTKFELVVNLKTAKSLNVTIPLSMIVTADKVIE
jgi:putative tryptophan/tyrosine transport system substrate-binding protein